MREVVIAGACRTPIGTFGGGLKTLSAVTLGGLVVADALKRAGVQPDAVDEVIMGNVLQADLGENQARQCSVNTAQALGMARMLRLKTVTLVHGMRRLPRRLGLATLCIGGGQGIALVVERAQ